PRCDRVPVRHPAGDPARSPEAPLRPERPLAEGLPRPFPGPRRPLPGVGLPGDGPSPDHTTGSVRIDSASATLRERAESGQINIKSTRFSTSSGTIQKAGDIYQVTSDSPPGGDLRSRARSAPPSLPPVLRRGVQAAQQVSPGDVVSV